MLSDEEKRKVYDRYGEDGLKQHSQGGGGGGPQDIFSQCAHWAQHTSQSTTTQMGLPDLSVMTQSA